jgi:hypothetical protein
VVSLARLRGAVKLLFAGADDVLTSTGVPGTWDVPAVSTDPLLPQLRITVEAIREVRALQITTCMNKVSGYNATTGIIIMILSILSPLIG